VSAIIFVVLALAWAGYLIPKSLKHHDEMASERLVEGHSDKVRLLSRKGRTVVQEPVEAVEAPVEQPTAEPTAEPISAPVADAAPAPRPMVTRTAARRAAKRRRRVLAVLVLALAVVAGLAGFAIVPWWSAAIPGGLVVAFLVVARLSVRKMQARRRPVVQDRVVEAAEEPSVEVAATPAVQPVDASSVHLERLTEDTTGAQRQEIEAVLADDGSLWDPLPMTLPTYVNKARARRTVRTIELTGINSSGHDEADTAVAREAQESAQAKKDAADQQRKVVGG
jgi:hypothetical protein